MNNAGVETQNQANEQLNAKSLQHTVEELRLKRQNLIFQIGNKMHLKVRLNQTDDQDFNSFIADITRLDKEIYRHALAIEELSKSRVRAGVCEGCGAPVSPEGKFCGSCGMAVPKVENTERPVKKCVYCEEFVSAEAVFCPCCGMPSGQEG